MEDIRDNLGNNQECDSNILKSFDFKIAFRKAGFTEISQKYYSNIGNKHRDI